MASRGMKTLSAQFLRFRSWHFSSFRHFSSSSSSSPSSSSSSSSSSSPIVDKRECHATVFFDWAQKSPYITKRKVASLISPQYGGYGLQAVTDIKKNEVILSVGCEIWEDYHTEVAKQYLLKNYKEIYDAIEQVAFNTIAPFNNELAEEYLSVISLTAVLLAKKQLGNVPYMNFVSDSINHSSQPSVLVMNNNWMDCLKGTICGGGIKTRRDVFHQIATACFPEQIEEFKDMLSVITSRGISGSEMPFTLVPYLDLANHSKDYSNARHHFNATSKCFELVSTNDIVEGDEVFINYGNDRGTNSFIYLYGFMEKKNPNDTIAIGVKLQHPRLDDVDENGKDWRAKMFSGQINDDTIYFQLPMEVFLQVPASDWELIGKIVADITQGKIDSNMLEDEIKMIMDMYKVVLNVARCAVCKTEEEYKNFPPSEEENAVANLLESTKELITQLKKNERPNIEDNNGDMNKPSKSWQEMCNYVRWRELETCSLFFRSMLTYGEAQRLNRENKSS